MTLEAALPIVGRWSSFGGALRPVELAERRQTVDQRLTLRQKIEAKDWQARCLLCYQGEAA